MLTGSAPGGLAVTRGIKYGKNLACHDWLLIGEVELVINCLVANCFLCRTDDVSKPPAPGGIVVRHGVLLSQPLHSYIARGMGGPFGWDDNLRSAKRPRGLPEQLG